MKRKATPLHGPQALHFSETSLPSGEKQFPISVVATIESRQTISSGYVVVLIEGHAASVRCDFENAAIAAACDVGANRQPSELVAWNHANTPDAVKTGRTPPY